MTHHTGLESHHAVMNRSLRDEYGAGKNFADAEMRRAGCRERSAGSGDQCDDAPRAPLPALLMRNMVPWYSEV